jgi:two-component system cell cycle sensor histidine kinase/response regulator CckA
LPNSGTHADETDVSALIAATDRTRDEIRGKVKAIIAAVQASEQVPATGPHPEIKLRHADGSIRTVEHRFAVFPSGNGCKIAAFFQAAGHFAGPTVEDIANRYGADEAVRQSERQFRAIFDNVGDAVAIHVPGRTFVEVNRVMCERLGYSHDELLNLTVADISAPEWREPIAGGIADVVDNGSAVFETAHLTRDGRIIPVEVSSRRIEYRGQAAILSVQRDISERKGAQEIALAQARFLQQIIDAIPIPIIAKDREGRVTLANAAFATVRGTTPGTAIGRMGPELGISNNEMHAAVDAAVMNDGQIHTHEDLITAAGGGTRRVIFTKAPMRADDGTIEGVIAAAVDITERFEAEQALRLSEEHFRTLFEQAGDAIFMWVPNGPFVEVNQRACRHLGYSRDELLAMAPAQIESDVTSPAWNERMSDLMATGSAFFETLHVRKDGTAFPVEVSLITLDLGGRVAVLGIARDITDRRQAEAERAALEEQLRQAQKMEGIGQLAGGIAHDFNNLLTAIRGYATLALHDIGPDNEARADLEQIERAADRAAGLTRQLLAFARRTVLQPQFIDLGEIVHNVEPMLTRLLGEDVALATITPPGRVMILADPSQIEQVIVNLAVNARDAMPEGGMLTIEAAEVDVDEDFVRLYPSAALGPNAMLSVADTGTGMDEATMAHIFEPFFTTKGPGRGTGLGLATVYGIVRQSGGDVLASSSPGRGSTFSVYLPLADPRLGAVSDEGPAVPGSMTARRRATILVVEDDPGVRGFVTRVLEHAGHLVLAAIGGQEAFVAGADRPIGLLLTDVVMPNMSGREVAARLTATHPGLQVLYMSGHAEHAIVRHGVLEPNINFLAKPFTAEALLAAVEAVLARAS